MKGDFTRSTWDRKKHYSSVRMQQGRVQVDADWNEQADIVEHLRETAARDVLGPCGVPREGGGFQIELAPGGEDLVLTAGRIYVDGILCEAEEAFRYRQQTDFPDAPMPPDLGISPELLAGPYLVYLDVWRRHVTALEDPQIQERALGGPDTGTRAQVIRQVKLLRALFANGAPLNCSTQDPEGWARLTAPSSGRLRARTQAGVTQTDPCIVPAQAGYTRLENQLYRVEVHASGPLGKATFKWSRNNGAVVTDWLAQDGDELTVGSIGQDKLTGFHDAEWVELTDDTRELKGLPGLLVRVSRVEGEVIEIDPEGQVVDRADFPRNPKIRRWDLPDTASGAESIRTPAGSQGYLPLENGIEVRFENGEYRTGDFWTIPARAFVGELAGEIEWPQEGPNQGEALPPEGIEHHYCKLGFVEFSGFFSKIHTDCRPEFPALTELRRFYLAGGDGQQALPGTFLPCPLRVAVTNGEHPVAGARVSFGVSSTDGRLERPDGSLSSVAIVETDAAGIAQCRWEMPQQTPASDLRACLRATAILLEDGFDGDLPRLMFSAEIPEARNVVYDPSDCPLLKEAGAATVQTAIDELCRNLGEGGSEPGIRIEEVTVLDSPVPVLNDGSLPAGGLAQGLRIQCDRELAPEAFLQSQPGFLEPAKPNCVVTLDLPYPIGSDNNVWDISQIIGFQPLILRARVSTQGGMILWQPHPATAGWLRQTLFNRPLSPSGQAIRRFLCHLTLKGNFIWNAGVEVGAIPDLYLDGDNFGAPQDARVGARFPSGDGRRGGDFEMWFWLERGDLVTPPQGLTVTASADGPDIFVSVLDQTGARIPGARVTLSTATAVLRSGTTDAGGFLVFRAVTNGTYSVNASAGGLSGRQTVTVTAGGLRSLGGVGATFQKRLEAAGISTIEEVAALDVPKLAKILGTSEPQAKKILAEAKARASTKPITKKPKTSRPAKRKRPAPKGRRKR